MKYILHSFQDSQFEFTKDTISQIIWEINNTAFSFVYKGELDLFIQNNQKALLNFKAENTHAKAAGEILHFIESNFTEHLDSALKISNLSRQKLIKSFGEDLGLVQNIVQGLPVKLLEISYPLLSPNKSSCVTVHQYRYFNKFYPYLIRKILENETITDINNWITFLIEANFNHLRFTNYLINTILKDVSLEDYQDAQMDILQQYHKKHSQAHNEMPLGYDPLLPSVSKQVIEWLDIEIKHCRNNLKRIVPNQSVIEFKNREKLQTSMSVPQLICVFRSFKDVGIITNAVVQDMLKAISESFETQNTGNISVKSLNNNYYDLDDNTKEETRRILALALKNSS